MSSHYDGVVSIITANDNDNDNEITELQSNESLKWHLCGVVTSNSFIEFSVRHNLEKSNYSA